MEAALKKVAAVLLFLSACATQHEFIDVTKPTVVAFIDSRKMSPEVRDVALDDFQHYLPAISRISEDLGITFVMVEEQSFRVDGHFVNASEVQLGFAFAAPGESPLILRGVKTDGDFACAAQKYFRLSTPHCAGS